MAEISTSEISTQPRIYNVSPTPLQSDLFPGTENALKALLFGLHREKRYINIYIQYNMTSTQSVGRWDGWMNGWEDGRTNGWI